jgi:hypothetical protein
MKKTIEFAIIYRTLWRKYSRSRDAGARYEARRFRITMRHYALAWRAERAHAKSLDAKLA